MLRVAILGLSPSTHDQVPWDWEVWGLPWDTDYPRIDRFFEMHDRELLEQPEAGRPGDYWERLSFLSPIYMQQEHPDIPGSVRFPLEILEKEVFSGFPRGAWDDQKDWYNSSPAYMLALAIHEKADEIGLWGVDLLDDSEFSYERPCLEYLIGLAVGRGIKITLPEGPTALGKFRGDGIKLGTMSPVYNKRYGYV